MDQSGESPLAQQGAVSEADSPYSDQNQEFSVPGDVGDKSSTAFGDKSPGHVTREPGNLHKVNLAGQTTGRGSLQYQGKSIPEQAVYLTQVDPGVVSFPEALQLALSCHFGDYASLSPVYLRWLCARSAPCNSVGSLPGHHLTL